MKHHFLASNALPSLLPVLIILLFHTITTRADEIPFFSFCPESSRSYTSGSKFESNLIDLLFPSLIANGPDNNGFFKTTFGDFQDRVYGLVQCRGDNSKEDCRTCLKTSSDQLIRMCPNKAAAAIRYENCLFRYADFNFFTVDSFVRWITKSGSVSVSDSFVFNTQLGVLMEKLSYNAMSNPSRFESGSIKVNQFNTIIYGMAQCNRDLSSSECSSCLQHMMNEMKICCLRNIGARVMGWYCDTRFEDQPFLATLPPSLPSPPFKTSPPSPTGGDEHGSNKGSSSFPKISVIVFPVIVGVLLLLGVCICFMKAKKIYFNDNKFSFISFNCCGC